MRTPDAVRKTIDFLSRPFIQRLSTLLISTLLAMSLLSTINVLALPLEEREVASSTLVAYPGAVYVQDLVPQRVEQRESERKII